MLIQPIGKYCVAFIEKTVFMKLVNKAEKLTAVCHEADKNRVCKKSGMILKFTEKF